MIMTVISTVLMSMDMNVVDITDGSIKEDMTFLDSIKEALEV